MKSAPPPARSLIFPRYRIECCRHPEERAVARVSKDGPRARTVILRGSPRVGLAPQDNDCTKQKPRPAGGPGEALTSGRRCGCPDNAVSQNCTLLDHMNDAAGTRFAP